MTDELRARLEKEIHRVDWKPLGPHARRGGLILVDAQLGLLEVAIAVAVDDSAQVRRWMEAGQLSRPTSEQIDAWSEETEERFTVAIVQPYVFVQRDAS